jgi:PAS domain-containing protein
MGVRADRNGRPALRLVVAPELKSAAPTALFCSHCGTRPSPPGNALDAAVSRVCGECGLGLILEAAEDIAPDAGDAFLVLDRALSVCAVSRSAERLLGASEPDAVNRHVSELLMVADAEQGSGESLSVAVAWAARGDDTTRTAIVRPANTFGIRLTARIAACGPPRAALVVLE